MFTGGPGAGKSRAAQAVTRIYKELGILPFGHLDEVAAADLAGATARETARVVSQELCRAGGVLMITEAHIWSGLPDRGQRVLRHLYAELTDYRLSHHPPADDQRPGQHL